MISAPFSLLQLPKLFSKNQNKVQAAVDGTNAYIGISSSSISAVGLEPPQELDAFSVSPGTVINALCVLDHQRIFYATREGKKHYIKLTNGPSVLVANEVVDLLVTGQSILAVYKNLNIEAFTLDLEPKWSAKEFGGKKEFSVFSSQIDDSRFLLISLDDQTYNLMQIQFSGSECSLLSRTELPLRAATGDLWSFSESTVFYASKDKIALYDIAGSNLVTEIPIVVEDILAVSSESCLVVQNDKVILLDSRYQAKLAERAIGTASSKKLKLLAFAPEASCGLVVDGESVFGFSLNVTQGSLLDSIGHGICTDDSFKFSYTDTLNLAGPVRDLKKTSLQRLESAQNEARELLKHVEEAHSAKNGPEMSKIVQYCKGTAWDECSPQTAYLTYEETDRHVDKDLIKQVALYAFCSNYAEFVPECLGVYLLTHPLFPTNDPQLGGGLFAMLESTSPLLYRQAVVTLKGASANDIIEALTNQSEDIFNDAVARLNHEFSYEQITSGFKAAFSKSIVQASNLKKLVTRLSQHPEGWPLVGCLVDSVGLHSWDSGLVSSLQQRLNRQIDHIMGLESVNLTISELLRSVDIDVSTGASLSRSEIKRKSRQGQQSHKKKHEKFTEIPRYSIETLVFAENQ